MHQLQKQVHGWEQDLEHDQKTYKQVRETRDRRLEKRVLLTVLFNAPSSIRRFAAAFSRTFPQPAFWRLLCIIGNDSNAASWRRRHPDNAHGSELHDSQHTACYGNGAESKWLAIDGLRPKRLDPLYETPQNVTTGICCFHLN